MPNERKQFSSESAKEAETRESFAEALVDALARGDMDRYKDLISLVGEEIKHPKDEEIHEIVEVTERLKRLKKRREKMAEGSSEARNPYPVKVFSDSARSRFYQLLSENFPELGVRVEDAKDESLVKVAVEDGDPEMVLELGSDPIVSVLTEEMGSNAYSHRKAERLEEEGRLPKGTADKLLARHYRKSMEGFEDGGEIAKVFKERLKELGAEPLSDEELDEIIMQAVERFMEEEGAMLE